MKHGADDEIRRLRACIRDLAALTALFTVTAHGQPAPQIAATVVDALRLVLDPDLIAVRLFDVTGATEIEQVWPGGVTLPDEFFQPSPTVPHGLPRVTPSGLRIVGVPMGLRRQDGVIVVAASRPDFPTDIEAFLLRSTENHASVSLQVSRYASELERMNRAKDDFLAVLSHELRTPLTSILGWAKMLRTTDLGPDATRHAIDVIERNARSQTALIDDLLDVSRIIAGKITLSLQRQDLGALLVDAVESARPAAEAKDITLVLDVDLHGAAMIDATRLRQVVANVLTNAIKFTPAGGTIRVRLGRDRATAVLTVTDTGMGIAPELLPYIFDRFRQADSSASRSHGGLGLGLAIVRHLVELHGGTVHAASEGVGQGAAFTIRLPLADDHLDADRIRPAATVGSPELRLHGLRVLVVDDHQDTRELLHTALAAAGADVDTAASGADAVRLFAEFPADILVGDIAMPDMTGYDVIRAIRGLRGAAPATVAVAVTAHARTEDRARALGAGYDGYVPKPVDIEALVELLLSLVARRTATSA